MNAHMRRLAISHFADHDHVRVLTQKGTQRSGKSQPDRGMHLRLVYAGNLIFDGILYGQNLARRRIESGKCRGKRRGLAGTGWPCDDDHPKRKLERAAQDCVVAWRKPDLLEGDEARALA